MFDEITSEGTLVERADLVGDCVVGVQDWPNRDPDRFVGAHVHTEFHLRGLRVVGDGQPDEGVVD